MAETVRNMCAVDCLAARRLNTRDCWWGTGQLHLHRWHSWLVTQPRSRPPVATWLRHRSPVLVCTFATQNTRVAKRNGQPAAGSADDMKISVSFASDVEDPRTSSEEVTSTSVSSDGISWQRGLPTDLAGGATLTASVVMMAVIGFLLKPKEESQGSVADLVKRGQLRADRGVDSKLPTYEDPFNNPLIQVGDKNATVNVEGRRFRVQPVTLTEEKVQSHQSRRTQAYRWKRPVIFLNEGDTVPEGVDPEEVRWIPANHPFATTNNYIDEELAQKNVYQTRGVPSRVRAEHEALRKKMMEAFGKDSGTEGSDGARNAAWTDPNRDSVEA